MLVRMRNYSIFRLFCGTLLCPLFLAACGGDGSDGTYTGGSTSSDSSSSGSSSGAGPSSACTVDKATGTTIDAQPFLTGAYGAEWNVATNQIAYSQPDAQGFYQIYTLAAPPVLDGAATGTPQALNATHPGLPTGVHQGSPITSASGNYLLFISQKLSYSGGILFGIPDYDALPGFGTHDDMWVAAADGSGSWQLTDEPDSSKQGVLLPVFSNDGQHIGWTDRQSDGTYVIKIADFVTNPQPALTNIQSFTPGGAAYYEPGSFTSDGTGFLYTSDEDTGTFYESQIYLLDLATGAHTRLTQGTYYNEHPIDVATPTGDWVIYMSDENSVLYNAVRGTDWYAMRLDGSDTKRLTEMNVVASPEYTGSLQVAGRLSMSPSGTSYLGGVQNSVVLQTGNTLIVNFTCQ
jgi:hypothetical protein